MPHRDCLNELVMSSEDINNEITAKLCVDSSTEISRIYETHQEVLSHL